MTKVDEKDHTGELGVLELRRVCALSGQICREVLFRDVGIDAFIEPVRDGAALGRLIGVQVKSGKSFVNGDTFGFTADYSHLAYWALCAFPVIGVVHDPESGRTAWIDITASCTEERFKREDFRLEVKFGPMTSLTRENLLGAVMQAMERFFASPPSVSAPAPAVQLEPKAAESAYETWFRLIGLLVGPTTRTEVAADAAFRLSWYMPSVTSDQKAAVVSAMQHLTDHQLLKIVAAANHIFERDDAAVQHVVDLLGYAPKTLERLEVLIKSGFVPNEEVEVAVQLIEVHQQRDRPDLRPKEELGDKKHG